MPNKNKTARKVGKTTKPVKPGESTGAKSDGPTRDYKKELAEMQYVHALPFDITTNRPMPASESSADWDEFNPLALREIPEHYRKIINAALGAGFTISFQMPRACAVPAAGFMSQWLSGEFNVFYDELTSRLVFYIPDAENEIDGEDRWSTPYGGMI